MNDQQVIKASHDIEELAAKLREYVNELREHPNNRRRAYALLYHFRTDLGRVVNTLGEGVPPKPQTTDPD